MTRYTSSLLRRPFDRGYESAMRPRQGTISKLACAREAHAPSHVNRTRGPVGILPLPPVNMRESPRQGANVACE
jgi:hypothetical protein